MEIAPAYMGVNDHILWCIRDYLVINILMRFLEIHNPLSGGSVQSVTDLMRKHTPGTVIQLQVSASGSIEVIDYCSVCFYDIFHQLMLIRIIFLCTTSIKRHSKLRKELCRGRYGLLCHSIFIL